MLHTLVMLKGKLSRRIEELVWCKTATAQYVNPEILPVLNSQKQDTKYHQNGDKMRKLLKCGRKKEPDLYSVSNRLFVPTYNNFWKNLDMLLSLSREKKEPCPAGRILGTLSLSHLIVTCFFLHFGRKSSALEFTRTKTMSAFLSCGCLD